MFPKAKRMNRSLFAAFRITVFFALLLMGATGCGVFEKMGQDLASGVTQKVDTTYARELSEAVVNGMLEELNRAENQAKLQQSISDMLAIAEGKVDTISEALVQKLIGPATQDQLEAMAGKLSDQLIEAISKTKDTLLDDQLEKYLSRLLNQTIKKELVGVVDGLWYEMSDSTRLTPRLIAIRKAVATQLDSLVESTSTSVAARRDTLLQPVFDQAQNQAGTIVEGAEATTKGIIRYLLIGVAALILLGGLIFQFVWKNRYKKMLSVISQNIDQINSQVIYDELTQSIRENMKQIGLEKDLREKILEKEGLIEQKEWDDKDQQVLKLILETLGSDSQEDFGIKSRGGLDQSKMDDILDKARAVGLETHVLSLMHRYNIK